MRILSTGCKGESMTRLYEQVETLPEGITGEILDGVLHTLPRPSLKHSQASSIIGIDIGSAYHLGRGGPGGWWILDEPEVHFILDTEFCVPDLAGWRRERLPSLPDGHKIQVVPDWICEVLSPSTKSVDREVKMPLYAKFGVAYLWLVDPVEKTLESYKLDGKNQWQQTGFFQGAEQAEIKPFDAITIALSDLWGE